MELLSSGGFPPGLLTRQGVGAYEGQRSAPMHLDLCYSMRVMEEGEGVGGRKGEGGRGRRWRGEGEVEGEGEGEGEDGGGEDGGGRGRGRWRERERERGEGEGEVEVEGEGEDGGGGGGGGEEEEGGGRGGEGGLVYIIIWLEWVMYTIMQRKYATHCHSQYVHCTCTYVCPSAIHGLGYVCMLWFLCIWKLF